LLAENGPLVSLLLQIEVLEVQDKHNSLRLRRFVVHDGRMRDIEYGAQLIRNE
jgi:hypothetical protein